jgi:hypothetical protein
VAPPGRPAHAAPGHVDAGAAVGCYRVGDRHIGYFVTWDKHQRVRAKDSKFPDPPSSADVCCQASANAPVVVVVVGVEDVTTGDEVEDGDGAGASAGADQRLPAWQAAVPVTSSDSTGSGWAPGFDRFWTAYPKHKARKDAVRAWQKLAPDTAPVEAILAAVETQRATTE